MFEAFKEVMGEAAFWLILLAALLIYSRVRGIGAHTARKRRKESARAREYKTAMLDIRCREYQRMMGGQK